MRDGQGLTVQRNARRGEMRGKIENESNPAALALPSVQI